MSKQEKSAKKMKKAAAEADRIIGEAVNGFKSKAPTKYDAERSEGCTDEQFALGVKIRTLREEGEPWWSIAQALELEGAGDSATTGKKGAARARGLYAKAFGSFPRTFKRGVSKADKNEHVRELAKTKRTERRAQAKAGKSIIGPEVPDEEVADLLRGRRIRWWSQSEIVPDGMDSEACVHPKAPLYITGEGLDRVIEFREEHRQAGRDIRWMPAHIRNVRLSAIYSVK